MHTYRLPLHLHIYDVPVMLELSKKADAFSRKVRFGTEPKCVKRVCFPLPKNLCSHVW